MGWVSLGTINTSYDWQTFNQPAVNTETFRLLMPPGLAVDGCVFLAPYYPIGGRGRSLRIYPFDEPKVVTLWMPPDLREAGELTRFLQVRKSPRVRVLSGQIWSLEVQAFY